jgi:Rod binding domain-containing protein
LTVAAIDTVSALAETSSPETLAAAREKLASLASSRADSGQAFTIEGAVRGAAGPAPREAFEKFEAFVLQSFIQSMLPENTESVFGEGLSGDMWKSMMAEQLAGSMARAGGIGIADRLLADSYAVGEESVPVQGVRERGEQDEAATRSLTSLSLIHEMERRVANSFGVSETKTGVTGKQD